MIGEVCKTVGVPHMVPLLDSKLRPFGTSGEISQLVTAPPPGDTVLGVMAWLSVKSISTGLYVKEPGATSSTRIVTVVVAVPPEFRAVMV